MRTGMTDFSETPPPIDFDRARLTWTTRDGSHGRWRIIASATARQRQGGWRDRVVLAPMVMAGDVYGTGRLPRDPPYSYQFIASIREHAIVREYCDGGRSGDTAAGNDGSFSSLDIDAPPLAARRLEPSELAADDAIWPLTGRIDISAPDARWLIDFPVNHLNSRAVLGTSEFQVETGPVLVPASMAGSRDDMIAGGFGLAFLFFNRLDRADLAIYARLAAEGATGRAYRRFGRIETAKITLFAGR